jgi:hypothetical protein
MFKQPRPVEGQADCHRRIKSPRSRVRDLKAVGYPALPALSARQ